MFSPVPGAGITTPYGKPGRLWASGRHTGVDFAAPRGSPVHAAVDGIVISAGWGGAYGNLVKIQHHDGSVGYYAHLDTMAIQPGARVSRGAHLGTVGSTGNSTGPHLHFEVRRDGQSVDPLPWLQGSGAYDPAQRGYGASAFHGNPVTVEMPDIEQYRNPLDALASLQRSSAERNLTQTLDAPPAESNMPSGIADAIEPGRGLIQDREQFLREQRMMQEQDEAMQSILANYQPAFTSHAPAAHAGGAGEFDRLFEAIRAKESGGNYSARNGQSGALGAYQIMPSNLPSWSQAALGRTVSTQEFLSNPSIQDQIARHRLHQYYTQHGAAGAALAWYAGPGALRYSQATLNRRQGRYPSMNDYVKDILRRAGL